MASNVEMNFINTPEWQENTICKLKRRVCNVASSLRTESVRKPRERFGFAHVRKSADPRDRALYSEAEARVGDGAVAADIEVPGIGRRSESLGAERRFENAEVFFALTAADDFPVAFRREDIHVARDFRILRVLLHIEWLDGDRVAVHHHRPVELSADDGLVSAAEIVTPFELRAGILNDFHRFRVGDSGERARDDRFERFRVAFQDPELGLAAFEDAADDRLHESFREF